MPALTTPTFRGMVPIRDSHFLDETQAVEAKDCFYAHGVLQPFSDFKSHARNVLKTSNPKSFFYWEYNKTWLSWTEDVDVINTPIGNDQYHRIYYTGLSEPRYSMVTPKGVTDFKLGVPMPTKAPTLVLKGKGDSGTNITEIDDDETRVYVFTYVTGNGEEGPPSKPSPLVTVTRAFDAVKTKDGQYVELNIPPMGSNTSLRNITKIRIYRSVSNTSGGDFLLVAEITATTKKYTDKKKTAELGASLVSDGHFPPSAKMKGLTSMPNAIIAGFEGNVLMLSEPSLPYAWNPANQLVVDSEIVGIGALATGGVLITKGQPYLISGYTSESMQLVKLDVPYGCQHPRSIVDFGESIVYASDVGLISVNSSGADNLTEKIIERSQWEEMLADDVHAYRWQAHYVLFTGKQNKRRCYLFSVRSGDVTEVTNDYGRCFQPAGTDDLYMAVGKDVKKLVPGAGHKRASWKGKEYHTPPIRFSTLLVRGEGNNEVIYYRDGAEAARYQVSGYENILRLPAGIGVKHQFALNVSGKVELVSIATSVSEVHNG